MRKGKDLLIGDNVALFRFRLNQAMLHDGISKKELASKLNVTYQAVTLFLNGNSTPSIKTAIGIAKALNVSLDWLCGLED